MARRDDDLLLTVQGHGLQQSLACVDCLLLDQDGTPGDVLDVDEHQTAAAERTLLHGRQWCCGGGHDARRGRNDVDQIFGHT